MRKRSKQSELQGSFLSTGITEESVPELESVELETVTEYLTFPKIVRNALNCPECGSDVRLRPDGLGECPNCTTQIPCKVARIKGEAE